MTIRWVLFACVSFLLPLSAIAAEHPGSSADCVECHAVGKGDPAVPKVMPQQPGFWARLTGKKPLQGHPSVSCAGALQADGSVSGCHRPEAGLPDLLVEDLTGRPVDEFCARCHPTQVEPKGHHPGARMDRDGDGVVESLVQPAPGQEVFSKYLPAAKADPLRTYPDALVFRELPDGTRVREVALPLATVVEERNGERVEVDGVLTCSTCHNPHYGYLVEVGSEEELDRELVAREQGDALLRLRDANNALCDACH